MPQHDVTIKAADGDCPAHFLTPDSGASAAAVLFYIDAGGLRPTALAMAQRLAAAGYAVLLPDPFYRYGPYGPFDPREVFKGDFRAILGPLLATTSNAKAAGDVAACLAWLDDRPEVASGKVGAVGFCMGAGMAIAAAGSDPRIVAVASFHGGNLATDAPDSPHRYAAGLEAEVYIAAADADRSYPPEMAERFEAALAVAGVAWRSEVYSGAAHGWMMPDFPVYDAAAATRGWREMLALFARALG